MTRFTRKTPVGWYVTIITTMALVLAADLYTPLGLTVWIFYLIPVFLSIAFWRPSAPMWVGLITTVLVIIGLFLSPPGINPGIAQINRGFGVGTIWILALFGNRFVRNKLAVRVQEWLQVGQTQLSQRMGGDRSPGDLGEAVLRFLAEYMGAHAAVFYIGDGTEFRRAATYAVLPEAGVPERFAAGEGLLGQAAKDKQTVMISDLPDGYFQIGSALGKVCPRHVLISPVAVDGEVNGVLEFGFIHQVHHSDKELLGRVDESIAVAIRSARYREKLRELLAETRRQTEELQAQSEELRVTNEELNEQSRALKETQTRLEQQQAELEQTNAQLEEQSQLLETRNDELLRTKSTLEAQTRELEQASRYKSDFLANMSHELRTPLNSSLILAKLLVDNRDGNLTAEQIKYAQTIQSAGQDLLTLINDILDLSKIEAGHMEVRVEPVGIASVLENLGRMFQPLAGQKGLRFQMQVAPGTPESLETDAQRLEQVVKNLLSNALKFTDKGEVSLSVSRTTDDCIGFAVHDTGIGIPVEQQHMIFEPFRQADGTTHRKYGGTGLGLSIARELARLLGGSIHLTSQVGQGSTFTVLVPRVFRASPDSHTAHARPVAPEPRSMPPPLPAFPGLANTPAPAPPVVTRRPEDDRERLSGSGRVILIVEDDETFAGILCELAHELNFQCIVATTAQEALALAAQFAPQAVLLDLGLPDYSGLSVLDRLKADARTRHIPVHVVSGTDYVRTALSLGAAGYMLKPVKREQLIKAFEGMEHIWTEKLRRVLIVEDDPVQLESLTHLLACRQVQVVAASSAAECLDQLKALTFDCMVMDLTLPDASGFNLLETLSKEDSYSFPPVIVYTGRDLSSGEEQRLRQYSKSIIIKGAKSPERLLDEVTLFLHQVVSELTPEQQRMLEKARSRDAALEGKRILVVEDDVRNVFALTSILEPRRVEVKIARNGREALEALDAAGRNAGQGIDLVLMDIMMPEMDGLTAIREIRKRAEWKKLPIIALTAKAMKNDQEQCLQAGANDYMAKPLDVEKLLSLVRVWVPR